MVGDLPEAAQPFLFRPVLYCFLHKHFGRGWKDGVCVFSSTGCSSEAQDVKEKATKLLRLKEEVGMESRVLESCPPGLFASLVLEDWL